MARPTKYNKEMQAKADTYLFCYQDCGDVIPSIEGLAEYLGLSRRVLYLWKDSHDEFMHTLERIEEKQKSVTLNSGLKGDFNATIAKLVLANHGMSDKQEIKTEGNVNVMIDGTLAKV